MKTATEFYRIPLKAAGLLLLGLLLLMPAPAPAQTAFSGFTLVSTPSSTNDNLLINITDPGSATGFRTRRISLAALFEYMGAGVGQVITTNELTSTNYSVYATNVIGLDPYIWDWFTTNAFLDTYVSNFFETNVLSGLPTNTITITNFYQDNWYVSNFFDTNVYITTEEYVSNYFTTNATYTTVEVTSNYTTFTTNITQEITIGRVGTLTVTNTFIIGTNWFNRLMVTNTISAEGYWMLTNRWPGPTNYLDVRYAWQRYVADSDCLILSLSNRPMDGLWFSATEASPVLLTISNSSASPITLRVPASWRTGDGLRAWVITNACVGKLSVEYDPAGATNAVFRMFY